MLGAGTKLIVASCELCPVRNLPQKAKISKTMNRTITGCPVKDRSETIRVVKPGRDLAVADVGRLQLVCQVSFEPR